MSETDQDTFRTRGRLILQLGDQLIKNEGIALLELVKNSYDACANKVTVEMEQVNSPTLGKITVTDDGHGMDAALIRSVWLILGSDNKAKIVENQQPSKCNRVPLGEKGIGRLSVHKLGNTIELISRMAGKKEVVVNINWRDFEKAEFVGNVKIDVQERAPEFFKDSATGTRITIRDLREDQWSDEIQTEVQRSISAMCSPFGGPDKFQIELKTDNPNLESAPSVEIIKQAALHYFYCELTGNQIEKFTYKFTPTKSMKGIAPRTITEASPEFDQQLRKMVKKPKKKPGEQAKSTEAIHLGKDHMKIGTITFEGWVFARETPILKLAAVNPKIVKEYLDKNGGVRVYRDGIRVYDYGEPDNDWLELEQRRLYRPGKKINSRILLAAVNLDRQESISLVEKTNREGFIDNEAYKTLVAAILYAIERVEDFREEDKNKVREFFGLSAKNEPVLESLAELKTALEDLPNSKTKTECLVFVDKIDRDYREIHEILLTSAEAGLNLAVAVHEIEKILGELKLTVQAEKTSPALLKIVQHLQELIEMYGVALKRSKTKYEDLGKLVEDALFHVQYRLKAHNVEVIKELDGVEESTVHCSARLVIGAVLNIVDNSIYWLERNKIKPKKLLLRLIKKDGGVRLLIADNGLGFSMPAQQMVKPFTSRKPGGMGLGLHIVHEVMSNQGGAIVFPSPAVSSLPADFSKGAVVALDFADDRIRR